MKDIKTFRHNYSFLSNFYMCTVCYEGKTYASSEHAYQAAKTLDDYTRRNFTLINEAEEAKIYGKMIKLREDWEDVKLNVMYDIVKDKFSRNTTLKNRLLATGDAHLEEGNHHGDTFWGTVNGVGENHLGKILMKVREELRNESEDSRK